MVDNKVSIFIIDPKNQKFIINVPESINYMDLKKTILDINFRKLRPYHIIFREQKYDDEYKGELNFEEGENLYIIPDRINEKGVFANFHQNYNLNEDDTTNCKLTGILRLILIKYISSFIKDINLIKSNEIREIISELKIGTKLEGKPTKDIQSNLTEKSGNNIISYTNYVCSILKEEKDIYNLLLLVNQNEKNEIIKYWSVLSKYEEFNNLFQKELLIAMENSYFDYSLIGLSIYQQTNRKEYLEAMNDCPNKVVKYLFHGTRIEPISEIITTGFLYTRKAFYGMGIYFSDMLDYVGFYAGGTDDKTKRANFGKILPINSTFSCVSAEVYYNKDKKKDIYDFSLVVPKLKEAPTYEEIQTKYKDQKVEKYGVHFAKVEPLHGRVKDEENIVKESNRGKFLGNEYVITEFCQILPLYGLTFKRNEYFILWRDPNFKDENKYREYLKERQLFIYKYAKMNAYFESSTEKALEIVKRKKFNKIILISSIGMDKSGKKFVEIARQILGFNIVVLFFSSNKSHFSWLKDFPNALYTNNASFYKEYILNYNQEGILKLKSKIENHYKDLKLKFDDNFLKYREINEEKYDNIIFNEKTAFKKVIIKNIHNDSILCVEKDGSISFKPIFQLNINSYIMDITILDGELTIFSKESEVYLGANAEQKVVTSEKYMQRFKYECKDNIYLIYYNDKNNILTTSGNKAMIEQEKYQNIGQLFKLIEDLNYS